MGISIIVAMAQNGVIGRNNTLPWHLPGELKYFKQRTLGKCVIMGRKTFDSIGKPLPNRTNIVVTRQTGWRADGVHCVPDVETALAFASAKSATNCPASANVSPSDREVMVIGGAEIYQQTLPLADRIYLTEVQIEIEGDAHFPPLKMSEWREVERKDVEADQPGTPRYSFLVLDRVSR